MRTILEGWAPAVLVIDNKLRRVCCWPYDGHPHGCPNFNKRKDCPPIAKKLSDMTWRGRPFLIWYAFPLSEHVERMRDKHPGWSKKQLRCGLYWQGTARKKLRELIAKFKRKKMAGRFREWTFFETPEACGLNVTETMRQFGIYLEWPPINYAYKVALALELKD